MEETYNLQAIVLNRQAFREADLRITIYTREKGKIDLVARGGKKLSSKLASHIEPFNISSIMAVKGKNFDYVGSAICRKSNLNLKQDLEKLRYAGQAISSFNKLAKEEDQEDSSLLFELLRDYLLLIDSKDLANKLFYHFFILKLLSELGYKPELYSCVECQQRISGNSLDFDFLKGGLICGGCKEGDNVLKLKIDSVKVLRFILRNNLEEFFHLKINDTICREVYQAINGFYKYQV